MVPTSCLLPLLHALAHTAHLHLGMLAGALCLDAAFGYPHCVFRAIRHPVVWVGALIHGLDHRLNRPALPHARIRGVIALLVILAIPMGLASLPGLLLPPGPARWGLLVLLAAPWPAQHSLYTHVRAVVDALQTGGLEAGRAAVSRIVGRDPASLDEAAVVRAALESLAENFSDGVVAPAVWGIIAGLPGLAGYKAINTADSMIGHRTPRHERFGWAAARLDDAVNLPASRLAALWIVLAAWLLPGCEGRAAGRAVRRDARRHRSPNAGWPEAAMAGALGLRLAGPRQYGGIRVDDAWMGDGRAMATVADLRRGLQVYRMACGLQMIAIISGWAVLSAWRWA